MKITITLEEAYSIQEPETVMIHPRLYVPIDGLTEQESYEVLMDLLRAENLQLHAGNSKITVKQIPYVPEPRWGIWKKDRWLDVGEFRSQQDAQIYMTIEGITDAEPKLIDD